MFLFSLFSRFFFFFWRENLCSERTYWELPESFTNSYTLEVTYGDQMGFCSRIRTDFTAISKVERQISNRCSYCTG